MKNQIISLEQSYFNEVDKVNNLLELEEIRVKYLGKKGLFSNLMMELKNVPNEEKPEIGKIINIAKSKIEASLYDKKRELEDLAIIELMSKDKIDISLPAVSFNEGGIHPLNKIVMDIEDLFVGLGYSVKEGPEVETDLYNFTMMNMDKDHPARAMQDSFYFSDDLLLRTHTSPVQARSMLESKGNPLKIICPGKTYRRDSDDATHSHQFMQIEGLVIDSSVTFAEFKDTLLRLIRHLFGPDREIRLRPSYFPFTEPSVEVDVVYYKPNGEKGYIEVCGAGMVHPNVLQMGGYNPEEFRGFAFGIGVERIAILKYGIENIRNFYLNDIRFLKQFRGV